MGAIHRALISAAENAGKGFERIFALTRFSQAPTLVG
jgi:hypothetical protein